ncbi:hypothetical protein Landi51_10758 [Colletotrichum acutatum]
MSLPFESFRTGLLPRDESHLRGLMHFQPVPVIGASTPNHTRTLTPDEIRPNGPLSLIDNGTCISPPQSNLPRTHLTVGDISVRVSTPIRSRSETVSITSAKPTEDTQATRDSNGGAVQHRVELKGSRQSNPPIPKNPI